MKAVSRIFVLSLTTLALSVACVEEQKKSTAVQQKPAGKEELTINKSVPELEQAARAETPTEAELHDMIGNWHVTAIEGADASWNPLTAATALGMTDAKNILQLQLREDRIHVLQQENGIAFLVGELPIEIHGRLLVSKDTSDFALPDFRFAMNGKDRMILKTYAPASGRKSRFVRESTGEQPEQASPQVETRVYTFELKRVADTEVVQATESAVKMDIELEVPETHGKIETVFLGKTGKTPNAKGHLHCQITKSDDGQTLRIDYDHSETTADGGVKTPAHSLRLIGNTRFDFAKELEEASMEIAADTDAPKRIGRIIVDGKRHWLLIPSGEKCTVIMDRKERRLSFAVTCADLAIDDTEKNENAKPAKLVKAVGQCILQTGRTL